MTALSIILFALSSLYFALLIRIRIGLRKSVGQSPTGNRLSVSIVVSARDEERLIEGCVRSLVAQDYPEELLEIIIVDDCSTDSTREALKRLNAEIPRITILSMAERSDANDSRKTVALEYGISQAHGEIILTTDADCIAPPRWAQTMAGAFEADTAMVVGPVIEESGPTLLSKISQVEFLGIVTMAGGLIGNNEPIICNGANLAFRKLSFRQAGGYGHKNNFVDDEVLMQRIAYRKIGRVRFCPSRDAVVVTKPVQTTEAFWHQRIRWAAKRGTYESKRVLTTLLLIYVAFLALFASLILMLTVPAFALFGALLLSAKVLAEYQVLFTGATLFGQQFSFPYFLVAEVFHIPYVVLAGAAGQFLPKRWKGRKLT
jgi:poly-beta-1,6-N-acetyl-D-glucosamine synthase